MTPVAIIERAATRAAIDQLELEMALERAAPSEDEHQGVPPPPPPPGHVGAFLHIESPSQAAEHTGALANDVWRVADAITESTSGFTRVDVDM